MAERMKELEQGRATADAALSALQAQLEVERGRRQELENGQQQPSVPILPGELRGTQPIPGPGDMSFQSLCGPNPPVEQSVDQVMFEPTGGSSLQPSSTPGQPESTVPPESHQPLSSNGPYPPTEQRGDQVMFEPTGDNPLQPSSTPGQPEPNVAPGTLHPSLSYGPRTPVEPSEDQSMSDYRPKGKERAEPDSFQDEFDAIDNASDDDNDNEVRAMMFIDIISR